MRGRQIEIVVGLVIGLDIEKAAYSHFATRVNRRVYFSI